MVTNVVYMEVCAIDAHTFEELILPCIPQFVTVTILHATNACIRMQWLVNTRIASVTKSPSYPSHGEGNKVATIAYRGGSLASGTVTLMTFHSAVTRVLEAEAEAVVFVSRFQIGGRDSY